MAVTDRLCAAKLCATCVAFALLAACEDAPAQQAYDPSVTYSTTSASPSASSPDQAPSLQQTMNALHDALHLTVQQEPAWQAYRAQAARGAQAQGRQQAAERMLPTLDAPRRMDLVEAEMRQELADLHAQALALKSFYADLTPQQRQIFDRRTLPRQGGQGY